MMFNVPQFIDIEDKIVGPFTAKQLGWLAVGGVLLLISWGTLDSSAFIFVALIIVAIFGALAFYKPYNQPLSKFILSSFHYLRRPKVYVWKRNYDNIRTVSRVPDKQSNKIIKKKSLNSERIRKIVEMVDRQ